MNISKALRDLRTFHRNLLLENDLLLPLPLFEQSHALLDNDAVVISTGLGTFQIKSEFGLIEARTKYGVIAISVDFNLGSIGIPQELEIDESGFYVLMYVNLSWCLRYFNKPKPQLTYALVEITENAVVFMDAEGEKFFGVADFMLPNLGSIIAAWRSNYFQQYYPGDNLVVASINDEVFKIGIYEKRSPANAASTKLLLHDVQFVKELTNYFILRVPSGHFLAVDLFGNIVLDTNSYGPTIPKDINFIDGHWTVYYKAWRLE